METGDPLITADWLVQHHTAPDVRVIDATWFAPFLSPPETGREAWARGHIPGAVHFDIDEIADTASPLPHMMPDPVKFSARVRALGIGDGHRIIVYDQNNFFAAARVWWMFRHMGKTDIKVLDGGLAAWARAGGTLDDMPPVVSTRHFTPRVRQGLLVDAGAVAAALNGGRVKIIDARPAGRFAGTDPEPRAGLASGHMPGSVNLPGAALIAADGTMKSTAELSALFTAPRAPTITTCGSGVTAAITALALARLGNWDVAVYDGSWSDWAADPSRLIEKTTS
jgi:thiosulfate/3-mercaptopyruvate sulfurtransferase